MAAHRVAVLLVVFLVVVCSADGGPLGCCGGVAFLAHGCYPAIMMPELMAARRVAALLVFCSVDGGPLGRHHDGVHYHPRFAFELMFGFCMVSIPTAFCSILQLCPSKVARKKQGIFKPNGAQRVHGTKTFKAWGCIRSGLRLWRSLPQKLTSWTTISLQSSMLFSTVSDFLVVRRVQRFHHCCRRC